LHKKLIQLDYNISGGKESMKLGKELTFFLSLKNELSLTIGAAFKVL